MKQKEEMDPHYKHQITATDHLWNNNIFALIMEQGTGKSRPVLDDWMMRVDAGMAQDLVILAPKGCYMNWLGSIEEPGELAKWIPENKLSRINVYAWRSASNKAQRESL